MAPFTPQQTFDLALQHYKAGRPREAETLCRQILAEQPTHFDALHLCGVIAHQAGRDDLAVDLLRRAVAINANSPEAHTNLGNSLRDTGQLDDAIAAQRRAIALNPGFPEAHNNLGNALKVNGQFNEASAAYRQAIVLRPGYAEAHTNLGSLLMDNGRLDEAVAAFRQAVALRPDSAAVHNNLGNALKSGGRFDEAISAYRKAIAINPRLPGIHGNLGNALRDAGRLDDALAAFRQAIDLDPDRAESHNNLGNALKDMGQLDDAIAAFRRAVALRPDYAAAYSNLLYTLHYHPAVGVRAIADELRLWDRQLAAPLRKSVQPHPNDRRPDRPLRIGYLSADFRNHASAHFLLPLLKHHDPRQVEVFCYAQLARPDAMTAELQAHAAAWRMIAGIPDEQVARQIRDDRIDILVDLKLHTAENRLLVFARKPAPLQAAWLGYPGSTGLAEIDFRLSDPFLDPPAVSPVEPPGTDESLFTERTLRLPDTFWCYDPLDGRDIPVNSPPVTNSGGFTFGSLNNFCKINDDVLSLWAKVLRQLENSRLLLLAREGSHRSRAIERLHQDGIDPTRVEFVRYQSRQKYLETYHRIDLALDTFPYNGHTTSLDSFWMGVPVVTLIGDRPVARAGWSQLSNLGLADLAAPTPDDFVRIAVELARDLPRLTHLRSTLRSRMEQSPLMDAPKFARNIESAYRQMWHAWCISSR